MDGSNINNNKASSIGKTEPIHHITQPPGPPPDNKPQPKYTFVERAIGTTAVGTTGTGVSVNIYDVHKKHALERKRFDVEVHTKAGEIRDQFAAGHITEKNAIYYLKNLQLEDQDIVQHLTSTGLFGINHHKCYGIVNSKTNQRFVFYNTDTPVGGVRSVVKDCSDKSHRRRSNDTSSHR